MSVSSILTGIDEYMSLSRETWIRVMLAKHRVAFALVLCIWLNNRHSQRQRYS
jgi:hypothetical protein